MAVPSTSATPSPTTATVFVTQTVTVKLLVIIPSLKTNLGVLLATERATSRRHLMEAELVGGPEERSLYCFITGIYLVKPVW